MNRILILEGDRTSCENVAFLLKREGYQTMKAENSSTGLQLAQQKLPGLIVIDAESLDRDGLNIVTLLRQNPRTTGIPVILLTSHIHEDFRLASLQLDFDAYLFKPCTEERLLTEISRLLAPERSLLSA